MKLMFTLRDDYLTLNRAVTEDYQYIRWCDEPLRVTGMDKSDLVKVRKGTVMPKHWMRQITNLELEMAKYKTCVKCGDYLRGFDCI